MPDITELLTSVADVDYRDLDLVQVERRSGLIRRRRRVVRSAAAGGVVLLAAALLRSVGGGPESLAPIPADRIPPASPQPMSSRPAGIAPSGPPVIGPVPADDASAGAPGASPASPPTPAADQATPAATASGAPPARSCSVSTTALAPEQAATCRFTATAEGGYRLTFSRVVLPGDEDVVALVEVVHAGTTTRYDAWAQQPYCRNAAVQPGDLVTVTVRQGRAGSYYDFSLGAGADYRCAS
jgi:hypothetical protein